MADFKLHDPSTYSRSRSTFAGNYYYTIAITPFNPSIYTGPPYFTVTSNEILDEDTILGMVQNMALSRRSNSYSGQSLEFDIIDATINKDLV